MWFFTGMVGPVSGRAINNSFVGGKTLRFSLGRSHVRLRRNAALLHLNFLAVMWRVALGMDIEQISGFIDWHF